MSTPTWRAQLNGSVTPSLTEEIDLFEKQIDLRRQEKMDEKVFAETRLRRGAYGQRYDNGQRHDGLKTRELAFPRDITKGPMTAFDAPGMIRIKIPYGGVNAAQMECMADLAEEYSDTILHVTTRQDIQLHYIHIEDTPDLMRRLGSVGITTREACGNSVRNITGCAIAGVCKTEAFDVTPYADALFEFLLGHKDAQDFGRKIKIAFSGCISEACGLAMMHDIGLIAQVKDGVRGFQILVGGGLGTVPYQAQPVREFATEDEMFPVIQAICRIFGRLGEKKNRSKARIKFLVAKVGIEEFIKLVDEELKIMPVDERWTGYKATLADRRDEAPVVVDRAPAPSEPADGFSLWRTTNTSPQRQDGYRVVRIAAPLGDITSDQARALADIARDFVGESAGMRLTVDQNVLLRWIPETHLAELHARLVACGLAEPGAESIVDVTSCPGTDTCKLGIASSRGLAGKLKTHLAAQQIAHDSPVHDLHIKVSGCFNSCGQHHVADIGFYGVTRNRNGYSVPHFHLILGGKWHDNAGAFGLPIIPIPSKAVPEALDRVLDYYLKNREEGEVFYEFIQRVGKKEVRALVKDLTDVPVYEEAPQFYRDWGDAREYTNGDIGVGECAGEVVSTTEFDLSEAERIVFDAQEAFDDDRPTDAATLADKAMLLAAKGLVHPFNIDVKMEKADVVANFRTHLHETGRFKDPFAGDKFAEYFFDAMGEELSGEQVDAVRRRVEEATLFIESAHSCNRRLLEAAAAAAK
jgi:sulfite reductase (ferredoxin)